MLRVLHVDYKQTTIKQYHKEGRALRTETTINDAGDFGIRKRLTNLPALCEVGFTANRRLLGVPRPPAAPRPETRIRAHHESSRWIQAESRHRVGLSSAGPPCA